MPIRDTFPYEARWDSVGLDCSYCRSFSGPESWPDSARVSCCRLHHLSLRVGLGRNGFKEGEWFCRDFAPADFAEPSEAALRRLDEVRGDLQAEVLYGFYGRDGNLKEYTFAELRSVR